MDRIELYERIEKYLAGQLNESEQANFEKSLRENPELADEVRLQKQIAKTLGGDKVHDFRAKLKEADQNLNLGSNQKPAIIRPINYGRILGIAASVLVILTALWFLFPEKQLTNKELFASNFEPYTMVLNQRSETGKDSIEQAMNRAVSNYNLKNYDLAAQGFRKLLENDPNNNTYQFYAATAALADGKEAEAITGFRLLLETPHHLLTEQSRWYLALAYLQSEQTDKSIEVLKTIKPEAYRFSEARSLIRKLEQ